jgi:hypothetical protein
MKETPNQIKTDTCNHCNKNTVQNQSRPEILRLDLLDYRPQFQKDAATPLSGADIPNLKQQECHYYAQL